MNSTSTDNAGDSIQFVTVVSEKELYEKNFSGNPNINRYELVCLDNTRENIAITRRYNSFLQDGMKRNSWVVLCHQDLIFREDPYNIIKERDTSFVYGVIGATLMKNPAALFLRRVLGFDNRRLHGQILQAGKKGGVFRHGSCLKSPREVDTVDCCCIILHASLVRRYCLRFDESLDFHLYSEDLSIGARLKHGVGTKAVQIKCKHLSHGDYNSGFHECARYLRDKYKGVDFASTAMNFS